MSLLLSIFFHFEVYNIENECSEKRETCIFYLFFIFFFNINDLKITFANSQNYYPPHA